MKRIRLIVALAVALPLLAVSAGNGAVVLCLGSDGHVTVEVADILSRCAESTQRQSSEHGQEDGCEACGPCSDIALLAQTTTLAGLSKKLMAMWSPMKRATGPSAAVNVGGTVTSWSPNI